MPVPAGTVIEPFEFAEVGVYYCTYHHGIMNEDMAVCDFCPRDEVDDEPRRCNRLQLGFLREPGGRRPAR